MALPLLALCCAGRDLPGFGWYGVTPRRFPPPDCSAARRRKPNLPPLAGLVNNGDRCRGSILLTFKGKVSIVNVWASWCVPCHDEARLFYAAALACDKLLQIVGINYKDAPDNARRFLGRYGNPFGIVGVDGNGRASIEWGVYGVPETFVVGREGTIVYKLVGPVTPANFDTRAQGRDRQGAEGGGYPRRLRCLLRDVSPGRQVRL